MTDSFDIPPGDVSPARPVVERVPRFRLLKLAGGLLALLPVLVIATWFLWNWQARARFDAFVAEHRALGQPVLIEDFQIEPVPVELNAAPLLERAAEIVDAPADTATFNSIYDAPPQEIAADLDRFDNMIAARAPALELVEQAVQRPETDWGLEIRSPVLGVLAEYFGGPRHIAKLLRLVALRAHVAGNHDVALQHVHRLVLVSERTSAAPTTLIAHLVRVAGDSIAWDAVEQITPTLRVAAAGAARDATAARREQVNMLMRQALDEESLVSSWQRALDFERLWMLDIGLTTADGSALGIAHSAGRLLAPLVLNDMLWAAEEMTRVRRAGAAPSFPAAKPWMQGDYEREFANPMNQIVLFLSMRLLPALDSATQLHFIGRARRRMAAVRLAMRLYELDHGRRPETLGPLVPGYLDEIPRDPFAADDRPIGYAPHADPPVLYSVGVDGVDDGGRFDLKSTGSVDYKAFDVPFFLDGRPAR